MKNYYMTYKNGLCMALLFAFMMAGTGLFAQATLWLGNDTDWNNSANWTNGVPQAGGTATISNTPEGGQFPVYAGSPVLDFSLQNSGELTFNTVIYNLGNIVNFQGGKITSSAYFVNAGIISFDNDGSFVSSASLDNYGTIDNAASADLSILNGTFNNFGQLINFGDIEIAAGVSANNYGLVESSNNIQLNGTLVNKGHINSGVGSSLTISSGASLTNLAGAGFECTCNLDNDGNITNDGDFLVNFSSVFDNDGSYTNNNKFGLSGLLNNNTTFTNGGALAILDAGDLNNFATLANNGSIELNVCGKLVQHANNNIGGTILSDGLVYTLNGSVNVTSSDLGFEATNINDRKIPIAGCLPNVFVILDENGTATLANDDIDKGSYGSCGAQLTSITLTPNSFTMADLGQQVVRLDITDEFGFTSFCDAVITVLEPQTPIAAVDDPEIAATCPEDISLTAEAGAISAIATWEEPTATSDCTIGGPVDCGTAPTIDGMMFLGSFNGSYYYKRPDGDLEFDDALSFVQSRGGNLPVVNSAEENEFLANAVNGNFWLAYTDEASEGNFEWFGGSSTYTNWASGEPNNYNGNEDHVHMKPNGTWNDIKKDAIRWAVMELPCNAGTGQPDCSLVSNNIGNLIYIGEHNNSKYYCSHNNDFTWLEAKAAVANLGGHLVIVDNAAENEFIRSTVLADYVWIGLTDEANEGTFVNVDGTLPSYTNWNAGEPNNNGGTEHYARLLRNNGKWTDRNAQFHAEFVMEVPCPGVPVTPEVPQTCDIADHGTSDNGIGERLVWIDFDNIANNREYAVVGESKFTELADGTALLTGAVQRVDNSNKGYEYSVKLVNKRTWAQWSALSGRTYKENNVVAADHTSWSYYELDNSNSTFTGTGNNAGQTLNISHAPSNFEFGFQVGIGANLKDGDYGFSGWFDISGSKTGHGDFNGDLDGCVPTTTGGGGNGTGEITITQIQGLPSGAEFPVGTSIIAYQITDDCGNEEICTFEVVIEDTPSTITVTCVENITIDAAPGATSAIATYAEPIAISDCYKDGLEINRLDDGPANGSEFPLGTTFVNYAASDSCFNFEGCVFTVTVNPTPAVLTVLTCSEDINSTEAVVNFDSPTGATTCFEGDVEITQIAGPASGSTFEEGTTEIVFLLTDDCSNTEICRFDVNVDLCNPVGGEIATTDPTTICVGDGNADPINVTLTGAEGTNSAWVITDEALNILGLPAAPPFDLEGAGAGTCLIWHVSFEDLAGAEVGLNAADLEGCFELSNSIAVTRIAVDGGEIATTDPTTICAGDGNADPINVTLTGAEGTNGAWVITDEALNILGLPAAPPFDLEGAGAGTCLIWHVSFEDITGAEVGLNAADLEGCFELSNSIAVTRIAVDGGEISTDDPTEIIADDGIPNPINVDLTGEEGTNSAWVITDADLNILGLPAAPPFDLEGAGSGTCLIWHLSFEEVTGAEVGLNAADLTGCFDLSNPIAVTRVGQCDELGGDTDEDGVCDANDLCEGFDDNVDSDNDGTPDGCDICEGSDDAQDEDGDGTPDGCDDCNNLLAGTACDDGDACTTNDVYDNECNCAGTFQDSDNDGVCDEEDCEPLDETLPATPGTACDDEDPSTGDDVILADGCTCSGATLPALTVGDVTVNEEDGTISIPVCLDFASDEDVTVEYQNNSGTALATQDFEFTIGVLTIPAGDLCADIFMDIIDDETPEDTEELTINLVTPTNAIIVDDLGTVTILDTDVIPDPVVSIDDVTVNEEDGTATLTVCLDVVSDENATVIFEAENGTADLTDYVTTAGSLTIPAGDLCAEITVVILDDATPEPTEELVVNLIPVANVEIGDGQGTITILDTDVIIVPDPIATIDDVTVNEEDGTATLTVCLDATSAEDILIGFETADGSADATDYTSTSGDLLIEAGELCAEITVDILDDATPEDTEELVVNLIGTSNVVIGDPQGTITILDTDVIVVPDPIATIDDVTVNEEDGTATLTVCLDATSAEDILIGFETADGSADATDYTSTSGDLLIEAGELCAEITVDILDDATPEDTEELVVNLIGTSNVVIGDPQGTITILDTDVIVVPDLKLSIDDVTVNEEDGTATLKICLDLVSVSDVTVDFNTADDSALEAVDYLSATGSITIPAGELCEDVVISIVDDATPEDTEVLNVVLSNEDGAVIADGVGTITILDTDVVEPLPTLSVKNVTVNEEDGVALVDVCLDAISDEEVTVQYTTADLSAVNGSDYSAVSGMLTIPAGEQCGSIEILILDDEIEEDTEILYVNITNATNATIADPQGTVTILDTDAPVVGGCDAIVIEENNGVISTSGYSDPIVFVKIYDNSWNLLFDSGMLMANEPQSYTVPGEGDYWVFVKTYGLNWAPICDEYEIVKIQDEPDPCALLGGDTDGDGVCDDDDICPGFDDNADLDGDGIPDGCDEEEKEVCTERVASNITPCNLGLNNGGGAYGGYLGLVGQSRFYDLIGGEMTEYTDGTATISGTWVNQEDENLKFDVEFNLTGKTAIPSGLSPKLNNCVSPEYGNFYYYSDFTGTLVGQGLAEGAIVQLEDFEAAFQIGVGANSVGDENVLGASAWFRATSIQQPTTGFVIDFGNVPGQVGDININLTGSVNDCLDPREVCTERVASNITPCNLGLNNGGGAYGGYLGLVGQSRFYDLIGGEMTEYTDGTATISGIWVNQEDEDLKFDVEFNLTGKTAIPSGLSPKLNNCVSPEYGNFYYYSDFTGTLVGQGLAEGAIVQLEDFEAAFQIGVGANSVGDENVLGASAWFRATSIQQPTTGFVIDFGNVPGQVGDININLSGSVEDCHADDRVTPPTPTNSPCGTTVTTAPSSISISGYSEPIAIIQVFDANWSTVYSCMGDCANPLTIDGLAQGTYYVKVKLFTANWQEACTELAGYYDVTGTNLVGHDSEMLDFNAIKVGREVAVNWTVNTAYKTDVFITERSEDGLNFEPVLDLKNDRNTEEATYYNDKDQRPMKGRSFYRLKQIFVDGTHRYSKIKTIDFDIDVLDFTIYPNPTTDMIYINLSEFNGLSGTIQLTNGLGITLQEVNLDAIPMEAVGLEVAKYPAGMYNINVKLDERKQLTKRFVKGRK